MLKGYTISSSNWLSVSDRTKGFDHSSDPHDAFWILFPISSHLLFACLEGVREAGLIPSSFYAFPIV